MELNIKKTFFAFLILLSSSFAFGDPDDGFPFHKKAPFIDLVEGTWVSVNKDLEESVILRFCQLGENRFGVSRLNQDGTVRYMTSGMTVTKDSVTYPICDPQFKGRAPTYLKVGTYYEQGNTGEVVVGITIYEPTIRDIKVIGKSFMRQLTSGRPAYCDHFFEADAMHTQSARRNYCANNQLAK